MNLFHRLAAIFCAAAISLHGNIPRVSAADASDLTYAGVDISSVISLEQSGVVFRDKQGNPADIFETLADAGVNTIRVRIWNEPTSAADGTSYGGGNCDTECAVAIAKRCQAAGLSMLVDFHYSDFWADPAKQKAPKAWEHYNVSQKADAIYRFTADTLRKLDETGVNIPMVQVGNETTTGMCGVHLADYNWSAEGWSALGSLMNAGAKAVREYSRSTKVVLHFTNPEKSDNYSYIAKSLRDAQVDYDVFATSYYPYWHGTLTNLTNTLSTIAGNYGKEVMVAETSWLYTSEDSDCFANTISGTSDLGSYVSYPISVSGQTRFLEDLFSAVANVSGGKGIGVFYWEPAWLGVGENYDNNRMLWERDGSGWATKAAMEYDPDAKYYGGTSVDNQALFAKDGTPLDSLYVFRKITGESGSDLEEARNLLNNPSFESNGGWTDTPSGWGIVNTAKDGHVDVRKEDPRSGDCAVHWYTEQGFRDSELYTDCKVQKDGIYEISMHIQGDVGSEYRFYAAINGTEKEGYSGSCTGWSNWEKKTLRVTANAGDTIGFHVRFSSAPNGYGSIDDCAVIRIGELPMETTTATTTSMTTTSATESTVKPEETVKTGDVNTDGSVDISDVILLARYAAEDSEIVLSDPGKRAADCNRDGLLNAADTMLILRMIAKLI